MTCLSNECLIFVSVTITLTKQKKMIFSVKCRITTSALLMSVAVMTTSAQSDVLHYNRPALFFEEALPIGNGNLGAMVYGGVNEEKLSLNDITLWTGEPDRTVWSKDAYKAIPSIRESLDKEDYKTADALQRKVQGHYSESYQPLGTLTVSNIRSGQLDESDETAMGKIGYERSLDISSAVAGVKYSMSGTTDVRYFASAPDSVIVMRISDQSASNAKDGAKRVFSYHCQLPHVVKAEGNELIIDGYAAYHSMPSYTSSGEKHMYDSCRGVHFRTIIHIENKDGKVFVKDNDQLVLQGCSDAVVLISNVTSFNGSDKDPVKEGRDYKSLVRSRIDSAKAKDYDMLLSRHKEDYKKLFDRFSIDFGTTDKSISALPTDQQLYKFTTENQRNPDLEELYVQYGRYLLISSSRTEGVPANLQGLWNEKILPPWSCNYTSNINVEENYWPSEICNLPEMHESLLGFIKKLPVTGTQTAKAYYGVSEGWCLAHNTDIWAMTCPVGLNGGDPSWANWNMGGAWISTHLWEHYLFTMDQDYLRDVYPLLKGAADFCLGWMIEKDGYLMTSPCTSPENKYVTDGGYHGRSLYGGFADIAMIKECLTDARDAAVVLGESKEYVKRLDAAIAKLLPYRVGKDGNLQEWYHDWKDEDPQHRHQSHLFGLFPGHHITVDGTPELAAACKRTLEIKGDKTTGWSTGWRVNLQARLHDGENAYKMYRTLLSFVHPDNYSGKDKRRGGGTYPNLFDAHSPFQIDGNFGGTAGVTEMLVQSSVDTKGNTNVELLPAMPAAWKANGSLAGVRLRGGYELSLSWRDGKVVSYTIKSHRNSKGVVKVSLPGGKSQIKKVPVRGEVRGRGV